MADHVDLETHRKDYAEKSAKVEAVIAGCRKSSMLLQASLEDLINALPDSTLKRDVLAVLTFFLPPTVTSSSQQTPSRSPNLSTSRSPSMSASRSPNANAPRSPNPNPSSLIVNRRMDSILQEEETPAQVVSRLDQPTSPTAMRRRRSSSFSSTLRRRRASTLATTLPLNAAPAVIANQLDYKKYVLETAGKLEQNIQEFDGTSGKTVRVYHKYVVDYFLKRAFLAWLLTKEHVHSSLFYSIKGSTDQIEQLSALINDFYFPQVGLHNH